MNAANKYLFDLNGYIIVRNVFSAEDIVKANLALDKRLALVQERKHHSVRNSSQNTPLAGDGISGRQDLGGLLEWGKDSDVFRAVLDHPKLRPYYTELLGEGYRMDHLPFAILQNKGSEGFSLHGGTIDCKSGAYNPNIAYECKNNKLYCHLLAVSVALRDQRAGDGGFVVVNGSHKSNFPMPLDMIHGHIYDEYVVQPVLNAGDVILFSEGTVHGARPWTSDEQRRIALYRFAPATCCYGRSYYPHWPIHMYDEGYRRIPPMNTAVKEDGHTDNNIQDIEEEEEVIVVNSIQHPSQSANKDGTEIKVWGLTDSQLAVLEPPYAVRIDRPVITVGDANVASVSICSRSEEKKAFDVSVFGTKYF